MIGLPAVDRSTLRERRRFAWRRWRRRFMVWRYVVLLVALIVIVSSGIWLAYFSGWMDVKKADIVGATGQVTKAQVLTAAQLPVGTPLVAADLGQIRLRVLANIPATENVDVTREWPSTVRIALTLRTPVAVVDIGGSLQALDASGAVFYHYKQRPPGLPLVQSSAGAEAQALGQAASIAASLPAGVRALVAYVQVGSVDGIALQLRSGASVVWGSGTQASLKSTVLQALMKAHPDARAYDVSVPAQPVITPK